MICTWLQTSSLSAQKIRWSSSWPGEGSLGNAVPFGHGHQGGGSPRTPMIRLEWSSLGHTEGVVHGCKPIRTCWASLAGALWSSSPTYWSKKGSWRYSIQFLWFTMRAAALSFFPPSCAALGLVVFICGCLVYGAPMWPEDLLSSSRRESHLWEVAGPTSKLTRCQSGGSLIIDMLEDALFYPTSYTDEAGSILLGTHWAVQNTSHSDHNMLGIAICTSSPPCHFQHSQQDAHQRICHGPVLELN